MLYCFWVLTLHKLNSVQVDVISSVPMDLTFPELTVSPIGYLFYATEVIHSISLSQFMENNEN